MSERELLEASMAVRYVSVGLYGSMVVRRGTPQFLPKCIVRAFCEVMGTAFAPLFECAY